MGEEKMKNQFPQIPKIVIKQQALGHIEKLKLEKYKNLNYQNYLNGQ